jgi:hypothetical protein
VFDESVVDIRKCGGIFDPIFFFFFSTKLQVAPAFCQITSRVQLFKKFSNDYELNKQSLWERD